MSVLQRLLQAPVIKLTRAACVFALLGLGLMAYSLLDPRALQVIVAMSLGHAFGFAAFGCYLIAIVLDVRRARAESAPASQRDSNR